MREPLIITNLMAAMWIFYTIASNIILATFLYMCRKECEDNMIRSLLNEINVDRLIEHTNYKKPSLDSIRIETESEEIAF